MKAHTQHDDYKPHSYKAWWRLGLLLGLLPTLWACKPQPAGYLKRQVETDDQGRTYVENTDPDTLIKRKYEFTTAGHQEQIEHLRQVQKELSQQVSKINALAHQHNQHLATSIQGLKITRLNKNKKPLAANEHHAQHLKATLHLDGTVLNTLEFETQVHKSETFFLAKKQSRPEDNMLYDLRLQCNNTSCRDIYGWLQQRQKHEPDKVYATSLFYYRSSQPYVRIERGVSDPNWRTQLFYDLEQASRKNQLRAQRVVWQVIGGVSTSQMQLTHPKNKDKVLSLLADIVDTQDFASQVQIKTQPKYFTGLNMTGSLSGLNAKTGDLLLDLSVGLDFASYKKLSRDKRNQLIISTQPQLTGPLKIIQKEGVYLPQLQNNKLIERVRFEVTDKKPQAKATIVRPAPPKKQSTHPYPTTQKDEDKVKDNTTERPQDTQGQDTNQAPPQKTTEKQTGQQTQPPAAQQNEQQVNNPERPNTQPEGTPPHTTPPSSGFDRAEPHTTSDRDDNSGRQGTPIESSGGAHTRPVDLSYSSNEEVNQKIIELRQLYKNSILPIKINPKTHYNTFLAALSFESYENEAFVKAALTDLKNSDNVVKYLKNLPYIAPLLQVFFEHEDVLLTMANHLYEESDCVEGVKGVEGAFPVSGVFSCTARNSGGGSDSGAFQVTDITFKEVNKSFDHKLHRTDPPAKGWHTCEKRTGCDARYYIDANSYMAAIVNKNKVRFIKHLFPESWQTLPFDYTLAMAAYKEGQGWIDQKVSAGQSRLKNFTPNLHILFHYNFICSSYTNNIKNCSPYQIRVGDTIARRIALHFITTRPLKYFMAHEIRPNLSEKTKIEQRIQSLFMPKEIITTQRLCPHKIANFCPRHGHNNQPCPHPQCTDGDRRLHLLKYNPLNAIADPSDPSKAKPTKYTVPEGQLLRHLRVDI